MTEKPEAIEVEVLGSDEILPSLQPKARNQLFSENRKAWPSWQGHIRLWNRRWWPLWIILGVLGAVLFMTVGLVFTAIVVILKVLHRIFNWLTR